MKFFTFVGLAFVAGGLLGLAKLVIIGVPKLGH
jgi:hypothetical protein